MKSSILSRLLTGLIVIGIGVTVLLTQTGHINMSIGELISSFWPVILIAVGLKQVIAQEYQGSGWWGLLTIGIGVVFLGRNFGYVDWSIGDIIRYIIPIVIIVAGLRMLFRPRTSTSKHRQEQWQHYRPYKNEEPLNTEREHPVPPAPPLHPDPTKPKQDEQKDEYQGSNREYEASSKKQKPDNWDWQEGHTDYEASSNHAEYERQFYTDKRHYKEQYKEHYKEQYKEHYKEQARQMKEEYRHERREHRRHRYHDNRGWWDHSNPNTQHRSGFIGDIHIGEDYWELKPLNISHFIGDTVLDLTKAHVPETETKIHISSFIGDVKVYVPNDYDIAVQVVSNAFIGDAKVLGQREGGIFTNVNIETPYYHEAEKRIKIIVSTFIGDVRVTKVG